MKLSTHFTLAEMVASQTASRKGIDNNPTKDEVRALRALCQNILEPVRLHFGAPVIVSSGYRGPKLNRAVGGSKTSQHCSGEAADFTVQGFSNLKVCRWIEANLPADQLIYEFGENGWIHCSYGPRHRRQTLSAVKRRSFGRLRTVYRNGLFYG